MSIIPTFPESQIEAPSRVLGECCRGDQITRIEGALPTDIHCDITHKLRRSMSGCKKLLLLMTSLTSPTEVPDRHST